MKQYRDEEADDNEPYDGVNPLPPQFCYLKPHYLDIQTSHFDHLERE